MNELNCLNLCESLHYFYEQTSDFYELARKACEVGGVEDCERIYVGSYFCSQYFLHQSKEVLLPLLEFCKKEKVPVTLVVPTFSEKDLKKGKQKISFIYELLGDIADEVVVNDYGMLEYMHTQYQDKYKIFLGRLFAKDYRDPRYPQMFEEVLTPKIFNSTMDKIIKEYNVKGLEIDPTHIGINLREAPEDLVVGVHFPYCYMTTGHICQYSSLSKTIDKKFRPNAPCNHECSTQLIKYDLEDDREWLRIGKTIYFENRECSIYELENKRNIYFPIDMEVQK